MPEAEATFSGLQMIIRVNGRHIISAVYCTRCMLYTVYACTRCQLLIMAWRDTEEWLNFVCCDDDRVVDENKGDYGWRWERCGGIWDIRGMTSLIWLGRPHVRITSHKIGTWKSHIGDGKLTCTGNSRTSQFLMMICHVSSHLSPSHIRLYHHLTTPSQVMPVYLSMLWSRVDT